MTEPITYTPLYAHQPANRLHCCGLCRAVVNIADAGGHSDWHARLASKVRTSAFRASLGQDPAGEDYL